MGTGRHYITMLPADCSVSTSHDPFLSSCHSEKMLWNPSIDRLVTSVLVTVRAHGGWMHLVIIYMTCSQLWVTSTTTTMHCVHVKALHPMTHTAVSCAHHLQCILLTVTLTNAGRVVLYNSSRIYALIVASLWKLYIVRATIHLSPHDLLAPVSRVTQWHM